LLPVAANRAASSAASVISSGRGQVRPGSLEAIVCQTLDEFIAQSTVKSTGPRCSL